MFVGRRPDNSIYGLWTIRQWPGQEELPADNADVVAFLDRDNAPPELTAEQKLAAVGLTVDDLKEALGLE